jgi:hypothetical protein
MEYLKYKSKATGIPYSSGEAGISYHGTGKSRKASVYIILVTMKAIVSFEGKPPRSTNFCTRRLITMTEGLPCRKIAWNLYTFMPLEQFYLTSPIVLSLPQPDETLSYSC